MQIPARASLITGFVVLPNFGQYSLASVSIVFGFVVLVDLCSFFGWHVLGTNCRVFSNALFSLVGVLLKGDAGFSIPVIHKVGTKTPHGSHA